MTNHKQFSGFSEEISKIILYMNLSIFYSLFGRESDKEKRGLLLWAAAAHRFSSLIPNTVPLLAFQFL
jgi:hypothetical protein